MTIINLNNIKNLYYANLLYELHTVEDKITFFEKKYNIALSDFESNIKNSKEEFEKWDDYMEWKAFNKKYGDLSTQKKDIEDGNFKVA